ncbi:hypothetical protein VNI00_000108 [Paramarasmius palmivorus]|uniref:GH16 domain-containing protein n=1 Tax=Paramarasmius palmivorus TaxID=297713 RepID=A0AAW0EEQ2_9AGAR
MVAPSTRTVSEARRVSTKGKLYPKSDQPGQQHRHWGIDLSQEDPDDYIHNPEYKDSDRHSIFSRGSSLYFSAGYPILSYVRGGPEIPRLGVNATGQIPEFPGNWGLVDKDTPQSAYRYTSPHDGTELHLVFSDEFNRDGRTFYPGDDPYWQAVDLHYYDPEAITTVDGSLKITLSEKKTHGLDYEGGMLQSWNKFCFTGGLVVANVMLPGRSDIAGLWPMGMQAVWSMGNLGRAGYGATNDGMWPYTYDACDVGTLPNQTLRGEPYWATVDGDGAAGGALSYAPGQRLSRCTCRGEDHPGPKHSDGTYVGRSAPEIDMIEAQVSSAFAQQGGRLVGEVSQSLQSAPFNYAYSPLYDDTNMIINDPNMTIVNSYKGGARQQALSCLSITNIAILPYPEFCLQDQACYFDMPDPCFSVYGFEYKPGYDEGYITWLTDDKQVCTIKGSALAADTRVEISARPVPQEPMYLIMNLGMSHGFGDVDLANLKFPTSMLVDYIRVYQPPDAINIGCDPKGFPTTDYIQRSALRFFSGVQSVLKKLWRHLEAYENPNLTTWTDQYGQPFPKNRLIDEC